MPFFLPVSLLCYSLPVHFELIHLHLAVQMSTLLDVHALDSNSGDSFTSPDEYDYSEEEIDEDTFDYNNKVHRNDFNACLRTTIHEVCVRVCVCVCVCVCF